jgi:hypothetical protein
MRDLPRAYGNAREEILARLIADFDDASQSVGDERADARAATLKKCIRSARRGEANFDRWKWLVERSLRDEVKAKSCGVNRRDAADKSQGASDAIREHRSRRGCEANPVAALSQNAGLLTDRFARGVSMVDFIATSASIDRYRRERSVLRAFAGLAFDRPTDEYVVGQDEPSGRGDDDFDRLLVLLEDVIDRNQRRENGSIRGNFEPAHLAIRCSSHDIGEGSTSVERDNPA